MSVISNDCIDTGSRFGDLLWVEYRYTFGNGYVHQIGPKKMPTIESAETECNALISQVEAEVSLIFRGQARDEIGNPPASLVFETLTPDFPDELPESNVDVSIDTRRRGFHRWLLRWVWPLDLLSVNTYWLDIWLWVQTLSAPDARTYLDIDVGTFNSISQRMGDAVTLRGAMDNDEPGEIP